MNKNILKDIGIVLLCVAVFGGISVAIVSWSVQLTTDGQDFMQSSRSFQAIATVTLICVGGIFAYRRLQLFRTFEPHLTISHNVRHRFIGDNYTHIDVTATLHNGSKVQVELRQGFSLLQLVSPVSDEHIEAIYEERLADRSGNQQLQWGTLEEIHSEWESGELIIEPGESHPETYEFIVSNGVESVIIYTYFYNPRFSSGANSAEGWKATTTYDMVNIEDRNRALR